MQVVVVGAGPAGLATAAELRRAGIQCLVLEKGADVGTSWRHHYASLRLHTSAFLSGLPGLRFPGSAGMWVAREGVVEYLESYARHHRVSLRTQTEVRRLDRRPAGWTLDTSAGPLTADAVVIATGQNRVPHLPRWPGSADFSGRLLHAAEYHDPEPFRERRVLVVGAGNSGAEIATDLAAGGAAHVWSAIRTSPGIMPRLGWPLPNPLLGIVARRLPPAIVDPAARGIQRLAFGDLQRHGLPPPAAGTYVRALRGERIPILDMGFVAAVRAGRIAVVPAPARFEAAAVVLTDGRRLFPDVVVAATGYRPGLEPLVGHLDVLDAAGRPEVDGDQAAVRVPGLFFVGYANPLSGQLREIGRQARGVARRIRREQESTIRHEEAEKVQCETPRTIGR